MEIITEVRRRHLVGKESISSIARDLKLSRPTVRKQVKSGAQPLYRRRSQSAPKLGEHLQVLEFWLASIYLIIASRDRFVVSTTTPMMKKP